MQDSDIKNIIWIDKGGLREFRPDNSDSIFKWNLFEKDGKLQLMVMSFDAGLDFHPDLLEKVCALKDWKKEELNVLGGGTRLKSGEIYHRSTHFGPIPEEFQAQVLRAMRLQDHKLGAQKK